ncbi:MAG TPA: glycosyltransferase family 39 protein [Rhodanobacteraceae bacterium]|nr:glycosyltransferase family 39 protein [Rhodanobacteraceae bacterium]
MIGIVAALAIAMALAKLFVWARIHPVSFDGAMNLEVARSLAEGHGYQRLYDGRSGFSHEIQSRAPLILPAAGVFAAFGVGVWQSQLTNLDYAIALAFLVFVLVQRWTSSLWGLVAAALCLWTPGLREIGMNGYGEVPALVWWLAALLVLCRADDARAGAWRVFGAGVLVGMAILTKTVLAIGLVAIVPALVATTAARESRRRSLAFALIAFAAGVLLPAALYEIAHVAAIGDVHRWRAWLDDEVHAIRMQAGTEKGFHDTLGIGTKLLVHSRVLADNTGLPLPLVPLWLAAPFVLAMLGRRWLASAHARAAAAALALFAAIYFLWWLGFTPTEKAWYRRIFNGVLAIEILLAMMLAAGAWRRRAVPLSRGAIVAAIAAIALQAPLLWSARHVLHASDFASRRQVRSDLALLAEVSRNARVFGAGWYSAPVLALYSGRNFGNVTTTTPAELAASSPVYLALDAPAMAADAAGYWLARYANRDVGRSDTLRLVELDARSLRDPFDGVTVDEHALRERVDFHESDYPYLFGFQNREGDGWRWAAADAEILLRYEGEPEFAIDVYLPSLERYRFEHGVGVAVSIGDCRLGAFRQDESARRVWKLATHDCALQKGSTVAVRLVSDNVLDSRDGRQLAYIVHALGFVDSPADASAAASQR